MLIARVLGEVVATQKHASHEGRKILMVQPLNLDGSERGDAVLALDSVDAGVGDRVLLVTEGYSAMTSVGRPESPIDMAVIGVIDRIDLFDDGAAAGFQGGIGLRGSRALGGGTAEAPPTPANLPVRDRRRRRPD
jgi:microcompartment protein CcmK/EutM